MTLAAPGAATAGPPGAATDEVDVVVVGGGPSGLAAATALRRDGVARVLVVEREPDAGGVPRHCEHTGFGVRDLHRVLSGPAYARSWTSRAESSGVEIRTSSMVTGWDAGQALAVTSPDGRYMLRARAVILATGARERPRAARLVPGDRPAGVLTTGQLQQLVQRRMPVGGRAVVVGAEHVSYSAVLTLRHAGVRTAAMVTELPRSQSLPAFDLVTRLGLRVPLRTSTAVTALGGRGRLETVTLRSLTTGRTERVKADTVVFSGDWIPDHELARAAGVALDRGSLGPVVDGSGATSRAGIWAAGNLVHPVETADVAARRGTVVGRAVGAWLRSGQPAVAGQDAVTGQGAAAARVPVEVRAPILWVSPNAVGIPPGPTVRSVLLRVSRFVPRATVEIAQAGRSLATVRMGRLVPNRSHHLPAEWLARVRVDGGAVTITLEA